MCYHYRVFYLRLMVAILLLSCPALAESKRTVTVVVPGSATKSQVVDKAAASAVESFSRDELGVSDLGQIRQLRKRARNYVAGYSIRNSTPAEGNVVHRVLVVIDDTKLSAAIRETQGSQVSAALGDVGFILLTEDKSVDYSATLGAIKAELASRGVSAIGLPQLPSAGADKVELLAAMKKLGLATSLVVRVGRVIERDVRGTKLNGAVVMVSGESVSSGGSMSESLTAGGFGATATAASASAAQSGVELLVKRLLGTKSHVGGTVGKVKRGEIILAMEWPKAQKILDNKVGATVTLTSIVAGNAVVRRNSNIAMERLQRDWKRFGVMLVKEGEGYRASHTSN